MHSVIMSTVSSKNISEIPDLIDICAQSDVDIFVFSRYCPTQCDNTNGITPVKYRDFFSKCYEKFEHYNRFYFSEKARLWCNKKDYLQTLLDFEKGRFVIPKNVDKDTIYGGYNSETAILQFFQAAMFMRAEDFQSRPETCSLTNLAIYG